MSGNERIEDGRANKRSIFSQLVLDEDGGAGTFQLSEAANIQPTRQFNPLYNIPPICHRGKILRIQHRINPTNAATYTLRIWEYAPAPAPYELNANMLYESPAGRMDDIPYDIEVEIPFVSLPATLFYSIEWTAAAGVTPGFIRVTGEALEQ